MITKYSFFLSLLPPYQIYIYKATVCTLGSAWASSVGKGEGQGSQAVEPNSFDSQTAGNNEWCNNTNRRPLKKGERQRLVVLVRGPHSLLATDHSSVLKYE
jgi:hypothetical protein